MKKLLIIIIVVATLGGLGYYAFKENTPVDDTKKLYISCGNHSESYEVYSNIDLEFAKGDDNCYLKLDVRNVDRNFVKLVSEKYFYFLDGSGKINDTVKDNDIYLVPGEEKILYGANKTTKFVFEYK